MIAPMDSEVPDCWWLLGARTFPLPHPGAGQPGALGTAPVLSIKHLGDGDRDEDRHVHGPGCGELETSSAVAFLGQWLTSPEATMGSWVWSQFRKGLGEAE